MSDPGPEFGVGQAFVSAAEEKGREGAEEKGREGTIRADGRHVVEPAVGQGGPQAALVP
ncbi:hypothetical protein [Streptomyces sp. NPDC005209]|uniref:hypothetical protein n=1 Tax=Streptomyces sp. NPDC005209 TaxID=3156715 RepID=UPI0033A5A11B